MSTFDSLTLYHYTYCSPCHRVIQFLDDLGVRERVQICNVADGSEVRERLEAIGGKVQVPCLVIDGVALYESEEIIEWIRLNLAPQDESK